MYGLMKIHHAIQTQESWRDWETVAQQARDAGHADVVAELVPPDGAGWRTVDKRLFKLCDALGWTWNPVTRRAEKM